MLRQSNQVIAFVLHQRDWQDSGRIFELLTRDHGRLSVFAQGVRGPKAKLAGVMQPFVPLLVSWAGRGEAPRLTGAEAAPLESALPALSPERVMPAFYLSELVISLTARHDPQPELFDHYLHALRELRCGASLERELRLFEKRLLDVLGYGMPREHGGDAADPLGLARVSVETLRRLADEDLDDPAIVEEVRPLLRRALTLCLDGRGLRTRAVAKSLVELRRATS